LVEAQSLVLLLHPARFFSLRPYSSDFTLLIRSQ